MNPFWIWDSQKILPNFSVYFDWIENKVFLNFYKSKVHIVGTFFLKNSHNPPKKSFAKEKILWCNVCMLHSYIYIIL